jgi:hypothetical protein
MSIGDVRPLIDSRSCEGLVRYFPPMVGEVPAGVLPAEWFMGAEPARPGASATT